MMIKNQIRYRVYKVVIGLLLIMAVSCDTFQEDSIPPDKLVEFGQTEFYILPGTSAVIDIRSIVEMTFANSVMTISKMPAQGVLTELNPLVLIYQPHPRFTKGFDEFEFSITENSKTVTQTISISVINNEGGTCSAFAVEDVQPISSDSSTAIKFLENDRLCALQIETVETSIYLPPKHGQATLNDNLIVYTPDSDSNDADTIVYKISIRDRSSSNPAKNLFGLISLSRSSCFTYLPESVQLDLTDSNSDLATMGDCGEGLLIYEFTQDWRSCQGEEKFSVELISESKRSGNICYQGDGRFVFVNNSSFEPKDENALFKICTDQRCVVLRLYVKRLKETWTRLPRVSDNQFIEEQARTIFFNDEQTGFVGGESIWKTVDGGQTWRMVFPWYTFGVMEINDIHFVDDNTGFAAYKDSFDGGLLKTDDRGEHWSLVESPAQNTVSVFFTSLDIGFIGTGTGSYLKDGKIYKTIDGGLHWTLSKADHFAVWDIQFLNEQTGFANAGRELLQTEDGGTSWQSTLITSISTDPNVAIMGLSHSGSQTFFIVDNALWTSADGRNFSLKRPDYIYSNYSTMSFSQSGQLGIVVGSRLYGTPLAEVLLSADYGETWSKSDLDPTQFGGLQLIDVSIPTEQVAFALAYDGHVIKLDRQ